MWWERETRGTWPRAGGWLDQPLELIVQMDALTLVYRTKRFLMNEQADWSKLSQLQLDLAHWLETAGHE